MSALAPAMPLTRWRSPDLWHPILRGASLLTITVVLVAAASRGFATSVPVAIVGLLLGLGLITALFRGDERRFLVTLFLAGFAIRLAVALLAHPYMVNISRDKQGQVTGTWIGFLFEDDRAYHKTSWALTRVWLGQLEGVASSDSYLLKNYTYAVGALYYLMYPFIAQLQENATRMNSVLVMAPKFMNAFIGGFTPVALFALGRELGGRRLGVLIALAGALWPSLVLWSVLNLKDILVVQLIALIMFCAIRFARKPSVSIFLLMLVSFATIENLRLYVFYAFGWLVPISFFLVNRSPWKRRLAIGVGLWASLLLVMLMMNQGTQWLGLRYLTDKRQEALYSSRDFGAGAAESGIDLDDKISKAEGGWAVQIRNIPIVLPYILFAPFPWTAHRFRELAIAPETLSWYAVQALSLLALIVLFRRRWREMFIFAAYIGGMVLIGSLIEGNVGTIFRHRSMLMPPAFTLAGLGALWLWDRYWARRGAPARALAAA